MDDDRLEQTVFRLLNVYEKIIRLRVALTECVERCEHEPHCPARSTVTTDVALLMRDAHPARCTCVIGAGRRALLDTQFPREEGTQDPPP
jgi:hypothetical protein